MTVSNKNNSITLDEINLIKYSEEAKDTSLYGNLFDIINSQSFHKGIPITSIKGLDEKARDTLFYNKKILKQNISSEWCAERVIERDDKKKVHCSLCNTPNKYLFYIRNKKNGTLLNVGSKCITKFPDIDGLQEKSKELKVILKNREIAKRVLEFNKYFENTLDYINAVEEEFNNLPILIPKDKYELIEKLIGQIRHIYTDYTQKGKCRDHEDPFQAFSLKVEALKINMKFANDFVEEHHQDLYICKRTEINWMLENNRRPLLKIAENDGHYNIDTIKLINSPRFIKDNFDTFVSKGSSTFFEIKKYDQEQRVIYLETKQIYNPPIALYIDSDIFMKEIGGKCIIKEDYFYDDDELVRVGNVILNNSNCESITSVISGLTRTYGCAFLNDEYSDCFYLFRIADGAIRFLSKKVFLNSYKNHMHKALETVSIFMGRIIKDRNKKWTAINVQKKKGLYNTVQRLYRDDLQFFDSYDINDKIFQIPYYNQKTSEDIEDYIDLGHPHTITFDKRKISKSCLKADYCVKISGNNMKPDFLDGDYIFIKKTTKQIQIGEIGIFYYDDNSYIKRYLRNEDGEILLKSLNESYEDVILEPNQITVQGRVLGYYRDKPVT